MNPGGAAGASGVAGEPPSPALPTRPALTPDAAVQAEVGRLQSRPTTAVTPIDIQTLSFPDGSRGVFSSTASATPSASGHTTPRTGHPSPAGNELDDSMSAMSLAPTLRPPGDLASLAAGDFSRKSRAWMLLRSQSGAAQPFESIKVDTPNGLASFEAEFDDIPDASGGDVADDRRLLLWKSKLKHYMVLSSAGKPVYSRHGDLDLINSYIGVVQTIISFYEEAEDPLHGFTAGNARFVVVTEGPLYLVAVSRLGESDAQLRGQLNALYMQILSTLTLPGLTSIFANRPSTDLRRPLEGTQSLLSSLADSFTRGSPSALLGALECLRLRKSQRHGITSALLRSRAEKLLYGLVVAGGRLVSVIRPRRHSLHPSDLELIFNMLFESGSVRSDGGENWIPLCLPAFNSRGYLYMYVSFLDDSEEAAARAGATQTASEPMQAAPEQAAGQDIAVILISPDKESFYHLKDMRDKLVQQLAKQGSLATIRAAARAGRPPVPSVAPGSPVSHFLYKSRANVQFCMSALEPAFGASRPVARRRLMTLYHQLHAAVHARHSHLKVLHCVADDASGLAWVTPTFELYCLAGPNVSRALVSQGANMIVQWARKEEERLFIIGGGVF